MTYRSESDVLAEIRLVIGTRRYIRLFRNVVGRLQTIDGRWVDFGLAKGSADLVGLKSLVITPDMVGQRIAQFVAIETKAQRGVVSALQQRFIDAVKMLGGRAGVAKCLEDAEQIIGEDHE